MYTRTLATLIALSLSTQALAGARKLPEYDVSSEEAALKSSKQWKMMVQGKPKTYPKTVAIPFFEVRYVFKETTMDRTAGQGITGSTHTTLQFDDADYEQLTNQLFAQLAARLEAEGMTVVPRADVVGTATYGTLAADEDEKESGRKLVFSPTGMKNLPVFSGRPRNPGPLSKIAAEAGADAAVAAFVNVAICSVEPTRKTGSRSGVYPCIRGDLKMPGFNLTWLGAASDGKKASWTARLFKQTSMYTYNKGDKTVYDMALVAPASAATAMKKSFWSSTTRLSADQQAYIGGTGQIYDDLLAMGFARWEDKFGGSRESAGLSRHAVGEAVADGAAPEPAPTSFPVPELPGVATCYAGTTTNGPMVLRRGVDADNNRVIEDLILELQGQPAYRAVSTWTVDGSAIQLADHAGAWSGTGALTGEPWAWTGWTTDLTMKGSGATVHATYTLDGGRYVGQSDVTMNGAVVASSTVDLAEIDADTCNAEFEKVAPLDGAW